MPRTKAAKTKTAVSEDNAAALQELIRKMDEKFKEVESKFIKLRSDKNEELDFYLSQEKLSTTQRRGNKTMAELKAGVSDATTILTNTLSSTKSVHKGRTLRRSASMIEDEGYLTAGSNTSNESKHQNRSKSRTMTKSTRVSRSLSRSKGVNQTYKTPLNKYRTPNKIGLITPKMQPHTPQLVLRRPLQGEVAVSMQGSPLLVSGVVGDDVANVNIPLGDGRVISIQPQRGLRMSLLPNLDADTRKQIEVLRDNLNKVCASTAQTRL